MKAEEGFARIGLAVLCWAAMLWSLGGQTPFGPGDFPPGPGRRPGPPGFGGFREERKVVKQFDKNGDKWLNTEERKAAREFLTKERASLGDAQRGPRGFRRMENNDPPVPGPKVTPADVKAFSSAPLYASNVLRTLFLEFESSDWEKELADFHRTDVEVPAKLTVDGKAYPEVGVHFRGASSYMMVGEGHKRSLNVSLDFLHKQQALLGYRTLNLLNSHDDPSFLRSVLFYQIAREYIPAPRANLVNVVINGESWGVFVNVEQFNKDFVEEWFSTTKGARWKVPGSPNARGGLAYLGEEAAPYKRIYTIKSKDDSKSWADLIRFCKILNQTPTNELEHALEPVLDIDGALKFLALDNALVNNDGYWIRSSDYDIYEDEKGRFHFIPWDANETFSKPGGPGPGGPGGFRGRGPASFGRGAPGEPFQSPDLGRRGPGADGDFRGPRPGVRVGVELDPLTGANDPDKPLLSKLLAVPALRNRYLSYVRDIAQKWLDWNTLGPIARQYHSLIDAAVKADTRKLDSNDDFIKSLTEDIVGRGGGPGGRGTILSLKNFADQRREYLLRVTAVAQP